MIVVLPINFKTFTTEYTEQTSCLLNKKTGHRVRFKKKRKTESLNSYDMH